MTAPSPTDAVRDVRVRPLAPGEERAFAAVMRRSFGGLAGPLFGRGRANLVAVQDDRIVGGVVATTFRIDGRRRGGVVKWVFTVPEARGAGVATVLVARALAWFDEQGVTDAFATIEGLNAGSSNRFARHGFEPLGFDAQVRRYGAALARVWWHVNHVVDVGHFLWVRRDRPDAGPVGRLDGTAASNAGSGLGSFVVALGLHLLVALVLVARLGELGDGAVVARVLIGLAVVLLARTGAMAWAAWTNGLQLRYRAWETGLLLAAGIAAAFGGPMVAPGGLYPRARTWSLAALTPGLARVAFAGVGGVLLVGWAAWFAAGVPALAGAADLVLLYARILLVLDVLVPFFPMTAFSGRRMLEASPLGWAVAAIGTVALWVASIAA